MNQSVARRAYEFVSTPRVVMDITPGIREVARVRIFKGPLASYRFLQRAMSSSFVVVGFSNNRPTVRLPRRYLRSPQGGGWEINFVVSVICLFWLELYALFSFVLVVVCA